MAKPVHLWDYGELKAEIDRLTAEVERYRKARNHPDDNDCCVSFMEENDRLRALVKELADDLESEVEGHYQGIKDHPAMTPKYERDMANVYKARKALANEQKVK